MLTLRTATPEDVRQIFDVFTRSVHEVCCKDYTPRQLNAWAPGVFDHQQALARLNDRYVIVADADGTIAGFGELAAHGKIDCFYCHPEFQRQGIGRGIFSVIEQQAHDTGCNCLTAEVSLTARPFFESVGMRVVKQQTVTRRDVEFTNFLMEKSLDD